MKKTLGWFLVILAIGNLAHAQPKVGTSGMTFLQTPPGVRAWGMGGAGTAVLDPFIGYFNPGGLGVFALTSPVGVARNSQDWIPYLGITYSNTVIFAGMSIPERTKLGLPMTVGLGMAYHRQVLDLNSTAPILGYGDTLTFWSLERSNNFTIAVAAERGVEFGLGITLKSVRTNWGAQSHGTSTYEAIGTASARDVGVYARVPVSRALYRLGLVRAPIRVGCLTPELIVTWSYVWANRGNDISDTGSIDQLSLPHDNRLGRSVEIGLDYKSAPVARILAARDDLTQELGSGDRYNEGWEVSLLGIFQIRRGQYWFRDNKVKTRTGGESLHLGGLIKWTSILVERSSERPVPWYIRNWDIYYQRARIKGDTPLDGTTFKEFGFTLNTELF
jgi:hypothetical protein